MDNCPATRQRPDRLSLPEELAVMLLNEETGYFHQVPGWELNCAVVGAVLAELSPPFAHRYGSGLADTCGSSGDRQCRA